MKTKTAILVLLCFTAFIASGQTKLSLVPTIHGLHKENHLYSYDSIRAVVTRLRPDVIVVELRSIDISADTNYLKKNYPYEMWMMRYWFPGKIIEGFDWLGSDLEGKPIPERYWQEHSGIKKLERQLAEDSLWSKRFDSCRHYTEERLAILKNKSLEGILKSADAELIRNYYGCMEQQLKGSVYEQLSRFYSERNRQMQTAISALIRKHQGKRMVILTGDDHYPYLLDYMHKLGVEIMQP